MSRSKQFWLFQLLGWGAWVLLLVVRDMTFVPAEYMRDRILVFILDASVGLLLSTGLRYLYRLVWDFMAWVRIAVVLVGCLASSFLWLPVKQVIVATELGASVDLMGYGWVPFVNQLPFTFLLLLIWSVLYFCIKYYQLFQDEKEKLLRSESLAREAQLRMLRYQLNPHFLFNTLNAISTLVMQESGEAANRMLGRLSRFLRYSLEHDPLELVPLSRELQSVQLYLDIEKVRFEDRLQIDVQTDEDSLQGRVPSMLLQPLVENAIKYAIAQSEKGGCIHIHARRDGPRLVISVADDGPDPDGDTDSRESIASCGVGLQNIRNRLRELYGNRHQLQLARETPRGFRVTVIIPYSTQ